MEGTEGGEEQWKEQREGRCSDIVGRGGAYLAH